MKLTDEDLDKIHAHLREKRRNLRCSVCDRNEWFVDYVTVELESHVELDFSRVCVSAVPIVCSCCGQVLLFSAKMMGVDHAQGL
jgi:hypothetical protein